MRKQPNTQEKEAPPIVAPLSSLPKNNIQVKVIKTHDGLDVGQTLNTTRNTAIAMIAAGYWELLE